MAYEEQESKKSRVVVQTPTSHREVVETESTRGPDRGGISAGTVGVIVVLAVALVTILVLLLLSGQSTEPTAGVAEQPTPVPQTTIVQQPAPQQPPVVIQQAPAPAPVIIVQPAPGTTRGDRDLAIETEIQKRFADDPSLSMLGVSATVLDGKVTLNGNVKTELEKAQAERTVKTIRGVTNVDNQILVGP